jgi:hypothetical protein
MADEEQYDEGQQYDETPANQYSFYYTYEDNYVCFGFFFFFFFFFTFSCNGLLH